MIKINLLPAKRKPAKKLTPLQQQLIIAAFAIIISLGIMFFWWWGMQMTIDDLKMQKQEAEATILRQENMLREVKNVEEEERRVIEKIGVINQLLANQTGPVRLLDEVSRLLPKGVGLTALTEKGGEVNIEGHAFTNNDVVSFIDNLKASPLLTEVSLGQTEQIKFEGAEIYRYKLKFKFKGA